MKLIALISLLILPHVFCKESVDDLVHLLDDPKVLAEIVKRLGSEAENNPVSKSVGADLTHQDNPVKSQDNCQHKSYAKTIIKTKDSTEAGAQFLDSVDGMESNLECVQKCCDVDGCELAVYENKESRHCYLFRCKDPETDDNYCQFANHADYISTSISHDFHIHHKIGLNGTDHENDLQDLSDKPVDSHLPHDVPSTTLPTTTTKKPELPHSVKLGEKCQTYSGCEDSHAICKDGTCACKLSYYNKHGTCREVCGSSRFECHVVDVDGPDCVRRSLVCDGTVDCHDGSDEQNCLVPDKQKQGVNNKPSYEKGNTDKVKNGNIKPNKSTNIVNNNSDSKEDNNMSNMKDSSSEEKPVTDNKDTASPDSHEEDNTSDENTSKEDNSDGTDGATETDQTLKDKTGSNPTETKEKVNLDTQETLIITKEKLYVDNPMKTAQGPIIALSLGLAFTFLLLIFIGCRMRNIKKRLRKGRVLHSNEADYLINGMYL